MFRSERDIKLDLAATPGRFSLERDLFCAILAHEGSVKTQMRIVEHLHDAHEMAKIIRKYEAGTISQQEVAKERARECMYIVPKRK